MFALALALAVVDFDGLSIDGNVARGEVSLLPGRHVLEYFDGRTVSVRQRSFEERTVLKREDVAAQPDDSIIVFDASFVERVLVDGYSLRAERPAEIRIPAGAHAIELVSGGRAQSANVELEAGERVALSKLFVRIEPQAVETPKLEEPSLLGPILTGAGGAALVGVALALRLSASSDRDRVLGAPVDARGLIVGLTYEEATELESNADGKATASAVLAAAGISAIAGAIIWWIAE